MRWSLQYRAYNGLSLTYKRLTPPTTLKKNKRRKTRGAAPFPDSKCVCGVMRAPPARTGCVGDSKSHTYTSIDDGKEKETYTDNDKNKQAA